MVKKKGKATKIAYTFVIADLLHYGIIQLLEKAKSVSDKLICGLLTDEAVEVIRGEKPVSKFNERKSVLETITYIDEVVSQHSQDPTENLKRLRVEYPNAELIFVYGDQWKETPGGEYLSSINAKEVQQKFYHDLSNAKLAYKTIRGVVLDKGVLDTFTSQFITTGAETFKKEKPPFVVTTKAQTLKTLKLLLKKSRIEDMYIFTARDWVECKEKILNEIQKKFKKPHVVVRSSCINEDSLRESKAGYYGSELNVNPQNTKNLSRAIDKVISTYDDESEDKGLDQVLVQKQTENILLSGVVFTSELNTNTPYYVINYDKSERTDAITSGQNGNLLRIFKKADKKILEPHWQKLFSSIEEIEGIIPNFPLDIEFAITKDNEVVIFQVRPLAANTDIKETSAELLEKYLAQAEEQYEQMCKEVGHFNGNGLVFSDMFFWNPAEIIGHNPSNLAYSLYDRIIMKKAWNVGLLPLGYPNLFPDNLMTRFLYKPYVNANVAFRVLVPNTIPKHLTEKLHQYYLAKLESNPHLHDKGEFEIVFSCYDFNIMERLSELKDHGFSESEIKIIHDCLVSFTNNILKDYKSYYEDCKKQIDELDAYNQTSLEKRKKTLSNEKTLYLVKEMLDKCHNLGTIPFTTAARLTFIAKALLQSLHSAGVITHDELDTILNSFSTIATDFTLDVNGVIDGKLAMDDFVKKYGHLRAGTYDIEKPRYDAFEKVPIPSKKVPVKQTTVSEDIKKKINSFLSKSPLDIDFDTLYAFASTFISVREHFKFVFTRTLSDVLELIKEAGKLNAISPKDISFLELEDIFSLFNSSSEIIQDKISNKKQEHEMLSNIILPPLIFKTQDFKIINSLQSQPNFVTNNSIEGETVVLEGGFKTDAPVEGKIVFIENADPGFHWLFSKNIKGLVTKYGGAASHMAICCAEFNIPAAIGCGDLYDRLKINGTVTLSCANKIIF